MACYRASTASTAHRGLGKIDGWYGRVGEPVKIRGTEGEGPCLASQPAALAV